MNRPNECQNNSPVCDQIKKQNTDYLKETPFWIDQFNQSGEKKLVTEEPSH